ncbi:hypothetical protein Q0M94_03990 [Deinococcus radiomollis]|uniref:hypothetical protein n=1 Tax=Deinococcus radiomollis TaxID=468916 RepID=UPI0038928902
MTTPAGNTPASKTIAPDDRKKYDQVFMQVVMSVQQQAQASKPPQPGNLAAMFHKEQVTEALQGCAMLIAGWNEGMIDAAAISRASRALKALGETEWATRVEGLVKIDEAGDEAGQ